MTPRIALDNFYVIFTCFFASLVAVFVCAFLYQKANKSTLLYEYLSTQFFLIVWTLSKIFKTVAPTLVLRWFFILVQYFAISFLGVAFLCFAYHYAYNKIIPIRKRIFLSIPALLSFLMILTNPLHHLFYATFDLYRDTFGPLFYVHQFFVYAYLIIGIYFCSKDFQKQTHLSKMNALILAGAVLFPLFINLLYVFKVLKILFHIRLPMDITPISCMLSYALFYVAVLRYRFLDVTPYAYQKALDHSIDGLSLYDENGQLYWKNAAFDSLTGLMDTNNKTAFDISTCPIPSRKPSKMHSLVRISDRRQHQDALDAILARETALKEANRLLEIQSQNINALTTIAVKNDLARHVHDVLGHGMVLVITLLEVALLKIKNNLSLDHHCLENATAILKENIKMMETSNWTAESSCPPTVSLTTMIQTLTNRLKLTGVTLEIIEHGKLPDFSQENKNLLYDICREAVTNSMRHGRAKNIHIFLRSTDDTFTLYILDDGIGCSKIKPGMGLENIEKRATSLHATLSYPTESDSGFSIHLKCPLNQLVF